jgi:hypothetical protein
VEDGEGEGRCRCPSDRGKASSFRSLLRTKDLDRTAKRSNAKQQGGIKRSRKGERVRVCCQLTSLPLFAQLRQ